MPLPGLTKENVLMTKSMAGASRIASPRLVTGFFHIEIASQE
jgi:hypothetical protein